jgi:hypothetical protein
MTALITELQRTDASTHEKRSLIDRNPTGPSSKEGEDEVVFFKDRLYVPNDSSVRKTLIAPLKSWKSIQKHPAADEWIAAAYRELNLILNWKTWIEA